MDVRNVTNQPVTTAFPIRETVQDWKPGAYFVVAWNAAEPPARSYDDDENQGGTGRRRHVGDGHRHRAHDLHRRRRAERVRALAADRPAAAPASICRCRAATSRWPRPSPPTPAASSSPPACSRAAARPRAGAVMASDATKQDFSRLELNKTPFDFSDRGVAGRDQPGPVDAFLYTERGVYRPGETVQLMAMLRDASAIALTNMPVTLIVKRPDGSEFTRFTQACRRRARCTSRSPCRNPRAAAAGRSPPMSIPRRRRSAAWSSRSRISCPRSSRSSSASNQPIVRRASSTTSTSRPTSSTARRAPASPSRPTCASPSMRRPSPPSPRYGFGSEDDARRSSRRS